jgi:hypothetical protein
MNNMNFMNNKKDLDQNKICSSDENKDFNNLLDLEKQQSSNEEHELPD